MDHPVIQLDVIPSRNPLRMFLINLYVEKNLLKRSVSHGFEELRDLLYLPDAFESR